jgi:septation ring formation regulator EzrA
MADNDKMVDAHEDRIVRIEDSIMSSNKLLAEHAVVLENIQTQVEDMKVELEDKIDRGFSTVTNQLDRSASAVQKIADALSNHEERIAKVEKTERDRKERWDKLKSAAVWIVAGLGGIFLKAFGETILEMLR